MTKERTRDPRVDDLPSIIIHPSVYLPERRSVLEKVCDGFLTLTKVTLVVTAVGTATFAIGEGIEARSLAAAGLDRLAAGVRRSSSSATTMLEDSRALVSQLIVQPLSAERAAPSAPPGVQLARSLPLAAPIAAAPGSGGSEPTVVELTEKPVLKHPIDLSEIVREARRMLALNRLEEAEAGYRRVLKLSDRQPAALLGLARVQLARGQLDEALDLAERAVDKAPNQVGGHLTLGDVLRARGAKRAADTQYQLATLLSPNHADLVAHGEP